MRGAEVFRLMETEILLRVRRHGPRVRAVLGNRGSALRNVTVEVPLIYRLPGVPTPSTIAVDGIETAAGVSPPTAHLQAMDSGEAITVVLTFDREEEAHRAHIQVRGDALLNSLNEWVALPASPR